jgi:hypothetical protein
LLPCVGSLAVRPSSGGMFTLVRNARLSYTDGPANLFVGAKLPKLIGGKRAEALPLLLGFSSLLHNLPLPWHVLRPTFQILLATRNHSFNLDTY